MSLVWQSESLNAVYLHAFQIKTPPPGMRIATPVLRHWLAMTAGNMTGIIRAVL
jgi:hypothetical protein